jgi:hypothetical protein
VDQKQFRVDLIIAKLLQLEEMQLEEMEFLLKRDVSERLQLGFDLF